MHVLGFSPNFEYVDEKLQEFIACKGNSTTELERWEQLMHKSSVEELQCQQQVLRNKKKATMLKDIRGMEKEQHRPREPKRRRVVISPPPLPMVQQKAPPAAPQVAPPTASPVASSASTLLLLAVAQEQ
jgi:hypothetical protein